MRWDALRTGDTAADWPLLHSVSCSNPDLFWTAVLSQHLRMQFSTPPARILQDNPQHPDQVRWLPGEHGAQTCSCVASGPSCASHCLLRFCCNLPGWLAPAQRALALATCCESNVCCCPAGACLNIAACALHTPLCPGLDAPAIIWAPEGQPTATQQVSWSKLRARCMQVAAAIAARFPPGEWTGCVACFESNCSSVQNACNSWGAV